MPCSPAPARATGGTRRLGGMTDRGAASTECCKATVGLEDELLWLLGRLLEVCGEVWQHALDRRATISLHGSLHRSTTSWSVSSNAPPNPEPCVSSLAPRAPIQLASPKGSQGAACTWLMSASQANGDTVIFTAPKTCPYCNSNAASRGCPATKRSSPSAPAAIAATPRPAHCNAPATRSRTSKAACTPGREPVSRSKSEPRPG